MGNRRISLVERLSRDVRRVILSPQQSPLAWVTCQLRGFSIDDACRSAHLRTAQFLKEGFMLWKKGWWETRWLFLIGLGSIFLAYFLTFGGGDYDAASWAARLQRSAYLSESERQALNNYQGQTRALWFKWLLSFVWANLAVIIGASCLMTDCPWMPSQVVA